MVTSSVMVLSLWELNHGGSDARFILVICVKIASFRSNGDGLFEKDIARIENCACKKLVNSIV